MAKNSGLHSNGEILSDPSVKSEGDSPVDTDCRLCRVTSTPRLMLKGELAFTAWDKNPASEGHFLAVPFRHFDNYFDITEEERQELWSLVAQGKEIVEEKYQPDGYNIGINVGKWAGQSIYHLHVHVIPRYKGDVDNPKGGVRGVIPEKKLYITEK